MADRKFNIRPFADGDQAAVYEVCLRTGNAGQDASSLFSDPMALGHIYVGPYMRREPNLAHVLCDDEGICGYVLGTRDSASFYDWYRHCWLPPLRQSCRYPPNAKESWSETDKIVAQYFEPAIHFPNSFAPYPAHLHIDLLPRAQGQGQGKRMIQTFLECLADLWVPGVHLMVAASNTRARKFYEKFGFKNIDLNEESVYMAKEL